jgi:hypothetical protein
MGLFRFLSIVLALVAPAAVFARDAAAPVADPARVLLALSLAPDGERQAWRLRLANDYVAVGLYGEARGVLAVMAAAEPGLADTHSFRVLGAQAALGANDPAAALALLDSPELAAAAPACGLRAVALARLQRHAEAVAATPCALPMLTRSDARERTARLFALARAHVGVGQYRTALALFQQARRPSPSERAEVDYWTGVIALRSRNSSAARAAFARAAGGPNAIAAARARTLATVARASAGELAAADAVAALARDDFVWRGSGTERLRQQALASLAARAGDLRTELAAEAVVGRYLTPGVDSGRALSRLADRFLALYGDGGQSLPPAEAFALFWEYQRFAPQGAAADTMLRRLAGRLAALGLNEEAARLLQYQIDNRLEGMPRAIVAAEAAALLNAGGAYQRALDVLAVTDVQDLPPDALRFRGHVRAQALIGLGRGAEARALLGGDTSPAAAALLADAAWAMGDWGGVISRLGRSLPAAEALPADSAALRHVLRLTVAAVMDGDETLLRRLAHNYAAALRGSGAEDAFEVLTGDPARVDRERLRAAIAAAAGLASGQPARKSGRRA